MSGEVFKIWLKQLGQAWQDKDAKRYSELFDNNVKYFQNPFDNPKLNREEIIEALNSDFLTQENIRFGYEIVSFDKYIGVCRWWCKFTHISSQNLIKLDGVFICEFDKNNLCKIFRVWRHIDGEFS